MEIQEAVYNLETGSGARWIRRVVIFIACIGLAFLFDMRHFRGFGSMEAMDAAQVARQIARGEGFTTKFIRPLALAQQRDAAQSAAAHGVLDDQAAPVERDFTTVPDTYNPPLYPYVLAGLFKITRVDFTPPDVAKFHVYLPEYIVLAFNEVCVLFSAWLLFLLALAIFDERVAWLSLGIYLLGDLVWRFGASGTAVPLTMLLLLGFFYLFHRALFAEEQQESGATWLSLMLATLLLGLAILADYGAAWLIIPYLAVILSAFRMRWLMGVAALVLLIAVLLPWGIRNASLTGDLLGGHSQLMGLGTASYPGTSLARTYRVKPDVLIWEDGFHKIVPNLYAQLDQSFALLGSSLITAFFFAGILHFFKRRRAQILRYFAFGGVIVLAVGAALAVKGGSALLEPDAVTNHLFLIWPLVVIFGTSFFFILVDRIAFPAVWVRTGAIILFLAINALPFFSTLARGAALFRYPPYFPPVIVFASQWFDSDEVIASDIPWAVAWYGDRPSLWLPATLKEYLEINDYVHPVVGILLTPQSRNAPSLYEIDKGEWKDWASMIHGHNIPTQLGMAGSTVLPPDQNDYLLVCDHIRWPTSAPVNK